VSGAGERGVGSATHVLPRGLGGPSLAGDYLQGGAAGFYAGHWRDPDAFREKLLEVTERFGPEERQRAAAGLRPTSERAAQRLERFVAEGGAVVTTGQQAGFLTGPLYTIHKALTTVRLAERLEEELGTLVLPVFWVASEDHDWAEVDHADLGTRRGVRRVRLPSGDRRALPMSERRLEADLESVWAEVTQVLSWQGVVPVHVMQILDAYRSGRTVAEAFGDAIASLLSGFDLLLTDAAAPAVKAASVEVLERSLAGAAREEALLRERGEALRAAGYGEQVAVLEGATNVFYCGSGERERLYRRGDDFRVAGRPGLLGRETLLAELAEEPGRFSPNVLLRPVVESAVFPTLAYVSGPSEIAYFAQLGVLFGEHGIRPPVVYPRFAATLVEPWVARELERLGLTPAEVERPRHELVEEIARAALPPGIAAALEGAGEAIAGAYGALTAAAEPLDPTLVGALARLRNESLARVGRGERKIVRALKRREAESIARLDAVRAALFPYDSPQERVLNVLPLLARDPELLRRIAAAIEVETVSS
jgi:bacillithiol synthase